MKEVFIVKKYIKPEAEKLLFKLNEVCMSPSDIGENVIDTETGDWGND